MPNRNGMNTPKANGTRRNAPPAPIKAPPQEILASSRFYAENNENNLTPEDLENIQEVNVSALVEQVKKYPGNSPIPSNHKILNSPVNPVPKMKLPNHLRGGKRKTHRKRSTKRKHTRKH